LIERISAEYAYCKSNQIKDTFRQRIAKRETMKRLLLFCVLAVWGWSHAEAQISKNSGDGIFQQSVFEYNHTLKGFTNGLVSRFDLSLSNNKPKEIPFESNPAKGDRSGEDNISGIVQNGWGNKALVSLYDITKSTGAGQSGKRASLDTY